MRRRTRFRPVGGKRWKARTKVPVLSAKLVLSFAIKCGRLGFVDVDLVNLRGIRSFTTLLPYFFFFVFNCTNTDGWMQFIVFRCVVVRYGRLILWHYCMIWDVLGCCKNDGYILLIVIVSSKIHMVKCVQQHK